MYPLQNKAVRRVLRQHPDPQARTRSIARKSLLPPPPEGREADLEVVVVVVVVVVMVKTCHTEAKQSLTPTHGRCVC